MIYSMRYPAMFSAVFVAFMLLSPYFLDKPAEHLYTENDLNRDLSKIYFDLGQLSQKRHDFKAAIRSYKKALEKNPYYLECYDYLGLCFELCHQLDKAMQTYLNAVNICPNFIEMRLHKIKNILMRVPPKQLEQLPLGKLNTLVKANAIDLTQPALERYILTARTPARTAFEHVINNLNN